MKLTPNCCRAIFDGWMIFLKKSYVTEHFFRGGVSLHEKGEIWQLMKCLLEISNNLYVQRKMNEFVQFHNGRKID